MTLDAFSSALRGWIDFILGREKPPPQHSWFAIKPPPEPAWSMPVDLDAWATKLNRPATAIAVASIALSVLAVAGALRLGWTLGGETAIEALPVGIVGSEAKTRAKERRRKRAIQNETAAEVDHLVKIASLIGVAVQINHAKTIAPKSETMEALGNELENTIVALCHTQQHLSLHYQLLNDFPGLRICFENVLENLGDVMSDLHAEMGVWSTSEGGDGDIDQSILNDVALMSRSLVSERQSLQFINDSLQRQLQLGKGKTPEESASLPKSNQPESPDIDFSSFIEIPPGGEDLPPQYSPPHRSSQFPIDEKKALSPAVEIDSNPIVPPQKQIIPASELLKTIVDNNLDGLSSLLANGANPNTQYGRLSRVPLHECARLDRPKHAAILIENGAEVDQEDGPGDTPLHISCWEGNIATALALIKVGNADVNRLSGREGNAPIFCAIAVRNIDISRLLLKHEARVSIKAADDTYPLHQASITAQPAMCELLIERGAHVDCQDREGNTPLHYAATVGHVKTARLLIDEGADVNARQDRGLTPLHWACQSGYDGMVKLLLANGAKVDAKAKDGVEPIHCAALKGHLECIRELVAAGARVNDKGEWDGIEGTPRDMAKKGGYESIVQYFDTISRER